MPDAIGELIASLVPDLLTSAAADVGASAAATAGAEAVGTGALDAALGALGTGAAGGAATAGVDAIGGALTGAGDAAAPIGGATGGASAIGDSVATGGDPLGLITSPVSLPMGPSSMGGVSAVGGAPAGVGGVAEGAASLPSVSGPINPGALTTNLAPGAPGAVAPVGGVSGVGSDLTSAAKTGAEASGGSILDKLVKGSNIASPLVAGGGLGYSLLKGNKQPQGTPQLAATAPEAAKLGGTLAAQGQGMTNYLPTGTLPPDMQASLDKATADAKTKAVSNAAAQGLPTDPAKNTVLAQALANIDKEALATKTQMEGQLLQSGTQMIDTGIKSAGLSTGIYNKLVNIDTAQQKQIGEAIANFAKSLGAMSAGKKTDTAGTGKMNISFG